MGQYKTFLGQILALWNLILCIMIEILRQLNKDKSVFIRGYLNLTWYYKEIKNIIGNLHSILRVELEF